MIKCNANGSNVQLVCDRCKRESDRLLRARYIELGEPRSWWLCKSCAAKWHEGKADR